MGRAGSGSDGRRAKPEGAEREESPLRLVRYRSLFGSNSPRITYLVVLFLRYQKSLLLAFCISFSGTYVRALLIHILVPM